MKGCEIAGRAKVPHRGAKFGEKNTTNFVGFFASLRQVVDSAQSSNLGGFPAVFPVYPLIWDPHQNAKQEEGKKAPDKAGIRQNLSHNEWLKKYSK